MIINQKRIATGGFHQAWLIPIEGLAALAALTIALKYNLGWVIAIILPTAIYSAVQKLRSAPKKRPLQNYWLKTKSIATSHRASHPAKHTTT